MVVEGPEVLHGGHSDDGSLVLLPGPRLVILEEPECPGVLERMLPETLWFTQGCNVDVFGLLVDHVDIVHLVCEVTNLVPAPLYLLFTNSRSHHLFSRCLRGT